MVRNVISYKFLYALVYYQLFLNANSQQDCTSTSQGKHFLITFPHNYLGVVETTRLQITVVSLNDVDTIVKFRSDHRLNTGFVYSEQFTLYPGAYQDIIVPKEFGLNNTVKSSKVIEVDADLDISVFVLDSHYGSSDAFVSIPTNYLGTKYVISAYSSLSLLTAIGAYDNTKVSVLLTAPIYFDNKHYSTGQTLQLSLEAREVVQLQSSADLTGTILTGNNYFAVISGNSCSNTTNSFCDILLVQNIPVSDWGKKHFYSTPAFQSGSSIYRMLAYYDGTQFTVKNTNVQLSSGHYWEMELAGNGLIVTDKPASLIQIILNAEGQTIDPSLTQIPSENQFGLKIVFATISRYGSNSVRFTNYVNIIVKSDEKSSVLINNEPISKEKGSSTEIPYLLGEDIITGSDYMLLVVSLPSGEELYSITQDSNNLSPMSAIVYGYALDESYSYHGSIALLNCKTSLSLGYIIAIVIVSILFLFFLITVPACICFCIKRRQTKHQQVDNPQNGSLINQTDSINEKLIVEKTEVYKVVHTQINFQVT